MRSPLGGNSPDGGKDWKLSNGSGWDGPVPTGGNPIANYPAAGGGIVLSPSPGSMRGYGKTTPGPTRKM